MASRQRHRVLLLPMLCALSASLPPFARAQELVISEVLFNPPGVDSGRQLVELRNLGDRSLDLAMDEVWLRWPPAAWRLPEDAVIPPGGTVVIHVNRTADEDAAGDASDLFTGTGLRNLRPSDAIALYVGNLFQDPAALLHFVAWGSGSQGGEDIAVEAGLWLEGDAIDVDPLRSGSSLSWQGESASEPLGTAAWCVDGTPSLGRANDDCATSLPSSLVEVSEIGWSGILSGDETFSLDAPFIELTNRGDALEILSGLSLVLGRDEVFTFPSGTFIGPGEYVAIFLGLDGESTDFIWFAGSQLERRPALDDSLALRLAGGALDDATFMVDFVLWGDAAPGLQAAAVAAGLWSAGASVASGGIAARGAIVRERGEIGVSAWSVDNTSTPGQSNASPPSSPGIAVSEVLLDPSGDDNGRQLIELQNLDPDTSIDLSRYTFCLSDGASPEGESCATLPPGTTIAAGGFLVIRLGTQGVDGPGEVFLPTPSSISQAGGSVALWLTEDVDNPGNLIDYVAWGELPPTRIDSLAVELELWPQGDRVDVTLLRDGTSLAWLGEDAAHSGDDAASFRLDATPSPGSANEEVVGDEDFRRADCNDDGGVDISDSVSVFQFLFLGQGSLLCRRACDANDDEDFDVSDGIYLLNFLFRGGPAPAAPGFTNCGSDAGVGLSCDAFFSC